MWKLIALRDLDIEHAQLALACVFLGLVLAYAGPRVTFDVIADERLRARVVRATTVILPACLVVTALLAALYFGTRPLASPERYRADTRCHARVERIERIYPGAKTPSIYVATPRDTYFFAPRSVWSTFDVFGRREFGVGSSLRVTRCGGEETMFEVLVPSSSGRR